MTKEIYKEIVPNLVTVNSSENEEQIRIVSKTIFET